jgi:predicted nucleotidyltransferase
MPSAAADYQAILRTLVDNKVNFIVVGGVSAMLHGATIVTLDLDLVHSREPQNLQRFLRALESLDAHSRERTDRKIRPTLPFLDISGHLLLTTSKGPLDVLGTIGDDLGYDELLKHITEMEVAKGLHVKVLNLDKYVEIKEKLNREKDRAVLPVLRQALEARRKRQSPSRGQRKKRPKKS